MWCLLGPTVAQVVRTLRSNRRISQPPPPLLPLPPRSAGTEAKRHYLTSLILLLWEWCPPPPPLPPTLCVMFRWATSTNRLAIINKRRCFHAASVDGFSRCARNKSPQPALLHEKGISNLCECPEASVYCVSPPCSIDFSDESQALHPRCLPGAPLIATAPKTINTQPQLGVVFFLFCFD